MLEVVRGPLAEPVLARAAASLAARCDLPVDRLQDAVLVLGALLDGAPPDREPLHVRIDPGRHALAICAGPYGPGEAQRLLDAEAAPGVPMLGVLTGVPTVEPGEAGDYVRLVVASVPHARLT